MPFECAALSLILLNLSGLPFFFGYYTKHLVLSGAAAYGSLLTAVALTAAVSGLMYSFKLIYYIFFDSKKARKSVYFDTQRKNLNTEYYSSASIASIAAIVLLTTGAYIILTNFFYQKFSLSLAALDSSVTLLQNTATNLAHVDKAQMFNYGFIN